ncbi:MAG: peptidoglycan recognition protein family protein [Sarcina sp.]
MKLKPSMKRKFVLRRTFTLMFIFLSSIYIFGQFFIDKERLENFDKLLTIENQKKIEKELMEKRNLEVKILYDKLNIIKTDFIWDNKKTLELGNKPKKIILHHSAIPDMTIDEVHEKHLENGWAGIGYHYFVRKDGSIYEGRKENVIGAHVKEHNIDTLGICLEGDFEQSVPTKIQYEKTLKLLQYLNLKYNIDKIEGHREHNQTLCPGDNLKISEIIKDLLILD